MLADDFAAESEKLLFEGAQCSRCDLDLDTQTGMCPKNRCPFHRRFQDEIVRWSPPGEEEQMHIQSIRESSAHQ